MNKRWTFSFQSKFRNFRGQLRHRWKGCIDSRAMDESFQVSTHRHATHVQCTKSRQSWFFHRELRLAALVRVQNEPTGHFRCTALRTSTWRSLDHRKTLKTEKLAAVIEVCDRTLTISDVFAGNDLSWQMISVVEASADIHRWTIGVIAHKDGANWQRCVRWCVHPLSSLLADQNFVVHARLFSAVEWQVHASMTAMNLSGRQCALVMRPPNEQFFARCSVSGENGARWNVAIWWPNPGEPISAKILKVGLEDFHAIVRDVAGLFRWNDFGWKHVTFVESTTDIDWRSISIVSGITRSHTNWHALVDRWANPVET